MTIYFTPTAQKKLESIWNYLKAEFGEKSAHTFREKTTKFLNTVSQFPEMGISEIPEKTSEAISSQAKRAFFTALKAIGF